MRIPFPHQIVAADYGIKNKGACYWMKMRTGKTYSSLLSVKKQGAWPLLIVCPKSVMGVWVNEFHIDGADPEAIAVLDGPRGRRMKLLKEKRPIVICNFEMLQDYDLFRKEQWAAIIIDESIKIGNISSKRTQYVLDYIKSGDYPADQVRYCLSGSPASESSFQLIPQMYFVHGNFMGYTDWEQYIHLNWEYNAYNYKWMPRKGKKHIAEIREWNKANSFQLTMEEIGLYVPLLRRRIEFPLSKDQERLIEDIRYGNTYGDGKAYTPLVRANHEIQVCAGLNPHTKVAMDTRKIEYILDWHLDSGEPCLVISELRKGILEAFEPLAKEKKIKIGFMVGGQPKENAKVKEAFDNGSIPIVFGQVEVVKMGLNFSRAKTIFYYSNSYSQDDRAQSEVRCDQMGKNEPTEIIDLVCPNCLDGAVVDLLEQKQEVSNSFVQKYFEEKGKRNITHK